VDTATLIRSARHRAGITQADLAARAHTSAPTISAYEHGTKQPRADVLLRLLRAAGVEPVLVPAATASDRYVDSYCDAMAEHVRRDAAMLEQARRELDRLVARMVEARAESGGDGADLFSRLLRHPQKIRYKM
jgi:transcriptional regulator with XRE-family HTH domain